MAKIKWVESKAFGDCGLLQYWDYETEVVKFKEYMDSILKEDGFRMKLSISSGQGTDTPVYFDKLIPGKSISSMGYARDIDVERMPLEDVQKELELFEISKETTRLSVLISHRYLPKISVSTGLIRCSINFLT